MSERMNTREGGTERTAAAGRASRELQIDDRVAYTCGHFDGVGVVDKLLPNEIVAVRKDDGNFAYPLAIECTPIADAPAEVVDAVFADAPLLLDDEPIDLGEVADEDALIGASLDAATLLVRICAADNEPLFERVVLNGITWIVEVRKAQGTP
jgi:hypothetical protein